MIKRSKKYKYIITKTFCKIIRKSNSKYEKEYIDYLSDNFNDKECRLKLYDIISKRVKHKKYDYARNKRTSIS